MAQRTRWMKGYMQVCVTHSRQPHVAWRRLGPFAFCGAAATTLGTVMTALLFPLLTPLAILALLDGTLLSSRSPIEMATAAVGFTVFVSGFLAMVPPGLEALRRRDWWGLLPMLLLLPFYYALIGAAAWRGLWELLRQPYRWNKTEHGLARTSRSAEAGAGGEASLAQRPRPLPPVLAEAVQPRRER
jgi:hypothetical protein